MRTPNFALPSLVILITILLIACNKEEENTYRYDSIVFILEGNDGIEYFTENLTEISVSNNSDKDIAAPRYNIYQNHQELYFYIPEENYNFSDKISTNIPIEIWSDGTIEKSIENYPYSQQKTIISDLYELSPEFIIPPHKHLEAQGEIIIKRLTLSYQINYINNSTDERISMKGKFYFYKPTTVSYKSQISDLSN